MSAPARSEGVPWAFFVLIFALSVPFVLVGALTGAMLPSNLPISALQFVVPLVAAALLVYRRDGWASVRKLLRRAFDWSRIARPAWYLPILLLMPTITTVSYGLMHIAGYDLPEIRFSLISAVGYFLLYLVSGVFEEVGWTGYATDPLQRRWGALGAGLMIGVAWAAWHLVPYLQVHDPVWVTWQVVFTVASRVVIVWLYNDSGRSVFAAVLFHAVSNVTYSLSAELGLYRPAFFAPLMVFVAVVVMLLRGSKSLSGR